MKPLVTVGMTAFNSAPTIGRAITSALAQDWPNLEIIIVDDASTDDTWRQIEEFAAAHAKIRAVRQPMNSGVAEARNIILSLARGEFLAFFDDDDESAPSRLTRQVERITRYEAKFSDGAPVICHTARYQISEFRKGRIEKTMGLREETKTPHGLQVAQRILFGRPLEDAYGALATCSQMARLQTYRQVGGFDSRFRRSEDTDICIRLAVEGAHFVGIGDPLVTQTLTPTSDKSLEDEVFYKMMLLEKHKSLFKNKKHHLFCLNWMLLKKDWLASDFRTFARGIATTAFRHPVWTCQRLVYSMPAFGSRLAASRFFESMKAR